MSDWNSDIEIILENIRINCVSLNKEHKKRYFKLKSTLHYYRLPIIILSGINSIVAVGIQNYIEQKTISMITCLLSLTCSIIGSIELYLGIQKQMENELSISKEYYLLSIDIHKTLNLSKEHRPIPAKEYLDKIYSNYCKLIENSNLLPRKIIDKLAEIPNIPNIPILESPIIQHSISEPEFII